MEIVIWEMEEKGVVCGRVRLTCWLLLGAGRDCRIDQIRYLSFCSIGSATI